MKAFKYGVAMMVLALVCRAPAAQYWWAGGAGTWDTSTENWKAGSALGPATSWPAGDSTAEAVFDGSGSEVTVSGTIVAGMVTFNTGGWSVTNGTLDLQGAAKIVLGSAVTAGVYSVIQGTAGMTVDGPGVLMLGSNNTYTGRSIMTNQAMVQVSGTSGTLGAGSTNAVTLAGGGIIAAWTTGVAANNWPITVGADGGTLVGLGDNVVNNGIWDLKQNFLYGGGTLTLRLRNNFKRFSPNGQANFSGKWIVDGSYVDYADGNVWGTASGDDVITVGNGLSSMLLLRGGTLGSTNQGITVGTGGCRIACAGATINSVAAKISGAGGDEVAYALGGSGATLTISNALNCYSGNTRVIGGTSGAQCYLIMGATNAIPGGAGKGNVILENGGIAAALDLNGYSQSINGLTNVGTGNFIDNRAADTTATLTVGGNDATSVFAGVIRNSGSGATLALTKIGTGVLTLSGTNSYSGATTVSNGVLRLTSTAALLTNSSMIAVMSGATLDASALTNLAVGAGRMLLSDGVFSGSVAVAAGGVVGGGGTIAGDVTNSANSTITGGGTNSVGTLTVSNLVMESNCTYLWHYSEAGSDRIDVGNVLTLPAVATVVVSRVSGSWPINNPAVILSANSIAGSTDLSNWVITGDARPLSRVLVQGNQVVLVSSVGTVIRIK